MAETVTNFLQQYVSPELVVFIISMLPILELRGGLIAASLLQIPWQQASVICIIGTILPVPFILLFIKQILKWLQKTKLFSRIAHHFEKKALSKGAEMIEKHPRGMMLALYIFVAIPLPGTGAWTGSLIASFLNLPVKNSFIMIALGCATATVIMLVLAYLIPSFVIG
ncbi:MAG: small multi-drug export protein [Oscillospiraceae bacterium]|nr:small multi-drug export protein [Oscillospiraceae bacterium]